MIYDKDYFENGIEKGLSCYTNYKWLPENTIMMAMTIIDYLRINPDPNFSILDFGCAKGFLVKALRLLRRNAWGCDISKYAINSSDNDTRKYLKIMENNVTIPWKDNSFDLIIAKDVLEHIEPTQINSLLEEMRSKGKTLFAVIPLGDGEKYNVPAYDKDVTHKIAKDKEWWENTFKETGWKLVEFKNLISGIKDNWNSFSDGNGFFVLERI